MSYLNSDSSYRNDVCCGLCKTVRSLNMLDVCWGERGRAHAAALHPPKSEFVRRNLPSANAPKFQFPVLYKYVAKLDASSVTLGLNCSLSSAYTQISAHQNAAPQNATPQTATPSQYVRTPMHRSLATVNTHRGIAANQRMRMLPELPFYSNYPNENSTCCLTSPVPQL